MRYFVLTAVVSCMPNRVEEKTMRKIVNLTMHPCSSEQTAEGVFEPKNKEGVKAALFFQDIPTSVDIFWKAEELAGHALASGAKAAMIGGAPYLMAPLERALKAQGVKPLYAFSKRESKEVVDPDGSTRKVAFFRHLGFVEA